MSATMFELVLRAPQALVEPASEALVDTLQALSVSVEDADAGSAGEQPLYGEPGLPAPAGGWARSTLSALFEAEADADRAAAWLLARFGDAGLHLQSLAPLAERDWVRLTQQQFPPVEIAPGFWIVPSWHAVPDAAATVLRLDPGLAFGTGSHPTTRMCLRWLAREAQAAASAIPAGAAPPGAASAPAPAQAGATVPAAGADPAQGGRVLDYGCGSGVLAIAAARLGVPASAIDAVDIDPAAVQATTDNAARNGVALKAGLPAQARGPYSVVLANILATPLKLLAPLLVSHLAPGGRLVLAGILERQADELAAVYADAGLAIEASDREEGWVLMTGRRPAGPAAVARA